MAAPPPPLLQSPRGVNVAASFTGPGLSIGRFLAVCLALVSGDPGFFEYTGEYPSSVFSVGGVGDIGVRSSVNG